MEMTFRWYGKDDPVKLEYIKQIPGMKGIVTAIYDIPVGEVWPLERILELKKEIENKLKDKIKFATIIHPDVSFFNKQEVGEGTIIYPGLISVRSEEAHV